MSQKPSIGRIVDYTSAAGITRPAIITSVWSETCVNLRVFSEPEHDAADAELGSGATLRSRNASLSGEREFGRWNWPARV